MLLQPCDEGLKTLVAIESAAAAAPAMAVDLTLWRFLEPVSVAYWHGAWLASAGGTQIATQLQTQAGTAAAKRSASVGMLLPPSFFTIQCTFPANSCDHKNRGDAANMPDVRGYRHQY